MWKSHKTDQFGRVLIQLYDLDKYDIANGGLEIDFAVIGFFSYFRHNLTKVALLWPWISKPL